jgi:hypothetical protein
MMEDRLEYRKSVVLLFFKDVLAVADCWCNTGANRMWVIGCRFSCWKKEFLMGLMAFTTL